MRFIIFSVVLFVVSAAVCNSSEANEYEAFAQRYESTFGEKPSDQVWNLGKETCGSDCQCSDCMDSYK